MIAPKPSVQLYTDSFHLFDFLNAIYKDEKELFETFPFLHKCALSHTDKQMIQCMYEIFAKQKRSDLQYIYDKMILYHIMFENNQDVHQFLFSSDIKESIRYIRYMLRDLGEDFDFKPSESLNNNSNQNDKITQGYQLNKIKMMQMEQTISELNSKISDLEKNSWSYKLNRFMDQISFLGLYGWTFMTIIAFMFLNFTIKVGSYPVSIIENRIGYVQINRRKFRIVWGLLTYMWSFVIIKHIKHLFDLYIISLIQNNMVDPNICRI